MDPPPPGLDHPVGVGVEVAAVAPPPPPLSPTDAGVLLLSRGRLNFGKPANTPPPMLPPTPPLLVVVAPPLLPPAVSEGEEVGGIGWNTRALHE